MVNTEIQEKISLDEFDGEKLISTFRLIIALIYSISVVACSILNNANGHGFFPPRAFIASSINTIYSMFIFIYLRRVKSVHGLFKYGCVIFDMTIISASVWIGCTYVEICPPITYLSIWALFYFVLILIGSFRYSIPCAVFSGIFAGLCYFIVVYIKKDSIDLPYSLTFGSKSVYVGFPIINELFRVIAMIMTGVITAMACKRHLKLFNNMIETQFSAALSASKTVEQSRIMSETIRKSTDEIFLSSKDVFSNANNQAASVQEIESTIKENARIAGEIVEKTTSVAAIASKMENDVAHGFELLERNINQLENIKSKNDGVISGIIALGNKITKIRDIVKKINTITDQTKVIAFNAALEAASAGDKGRRFSVVADEVNRLANDIAALTDQIKENVEEIQNSSSTLIISSEESSDQIILGNNLIKELEEIFCKIRSGAEITSNQAQIITISSQKQQKSTDQINVAIADISKGLTNFIHSTRVSTSSAEELTQLMNELGVILTNYISDNNSNK